MQLPIVQAARPLLRAYSLETFQVVVAQSVTFMHNRRLLSVVTSPLHRISERSAPLRPAICRASCATSTVHELRRSSERWTPSLSRRHWCRFHPGVRYGSVGPVSFSWIRTPSRIYDGRRSWVFDHVY